MITYLIQSCSHCWVFQIFWHNECSILTASCFRIWNSSTGIPSPPLALFVVMLPKAHLTSHSRMSGSRWVITPLWLSRSWRSFLFSSSVYSCHLFLISSASIRSIPFLSFMSHRWGKNWEILKNVESCQNRTKSTWKVRGARIKERDREGFRHNGGFRARGQGNSEGRKLQGGKRENLNLCFALWMELPLVFFKRFQGTSLVVQSLRICLPMLGTQVWSLVWEDSMCHRAAKPTSRNYWACALETQNHSYWAIMLQLLKFRHLDPELCNKRNHATKESLHSATKTQPDKNK